VSGPAATGATGSRARRPAGRPPRREGRRRRFLIQKPRAERAGGAVSTGSAPESGSHTAAPAAAQEWAEAVGAEPRELTEAPTG
jgi:hypothetical protein